MPDPIFDIDSIKLDDIKIPGAVAPVVVEKIEEEKKKDAEAAVVKTDEEKKKDAEAVVVKTDEEKKKDVEAAAALVKDEDKTEGLVKIKKDESAAAVEETQEIDWDGLSTEAGFKIESEDELVGALKELNEYKALSPALQKAIEIEKNKGDVSAYFKLMSDDPDKLSDREVLWRKFANENPKLISQSEKFARLDFEKKTNKEYDLLIQFNAKNADEKEEFLKEHKDDIEYLREKVKMEVEAGRASLKEIRDSASFFEPGTKISEKEAKATLDAHNKGTQDAIASFDAVGIPVGDDSEYRVAINDTNRALVTAWMKSPELFFKELGFTNESIDYDKFVGFATLLADIQSGNFGEKFRKSILDSKDIKTLDSELDGVKKINRDGQAAGEKDMFEQIGDKVVEQREKRRA